MLTGQPTYRNCRQTNVEFKAVDFVMHLQLTSIALRLERG